MKKHLQTADILLPKSDFKEWSVIACDQYTSEPEYWKEVEKTVGNKASAYNIILPEVFLSEDNSEKIASVNNKMVEYLNSDVFNIYDNTMVYIERTQKDGKIRKGVLGLIDLEDYSYVKGADTFIRATEQTVLDRIPPRVNIRKDASIELPHIMLLIDDPKRTVIEPLSDKTNNFNCLYDFELMQNAGSIKGYALNESTVVDVQNALSDLSNNSSDGLLFAVGDGNHSLASAKECYVNGFGPRYALAEVVNIHDSSLEFEPIYRVLFGVKPEKVISDFVDTLGGIYKGEDAQEFVCVFGDNKKTISVKPTGKLCVATLQTFLDEYIKNTDIKIDYIHGENSVFELSKKENTLGFLFSGMEKSELFVAVSQDGSLPRKTFSMGCADDKRFYLEGRRIK
ncbi:MAG: DUF1015 domain-containing protein [Clostridia bacterium]|nr:DUF1015 domain-containing protein [Clostridia bacterium]